MIWLSASAKKGIVFNVTSVWILHTFLAMRFAGKLPKDNSGRKLQPLLCRWLIRMGRVHHAKGHIAPIICGRAAPHECAAISVPDQHTCCQQDKACDR